MISCNRFAGTNTAGNIVIDYERAISRLDLSEEIDFFTTDNAENMSSAFDLPEFEQSKEATTDFDYVVLESYLHNLFKLSPRSISPIGRKVRLVRCSFYSSTLK